MQNLPNPDGETDELPLRRSLIRFLKYALVAALLSCIAFFAWTQIYNATREKDNVYEEVHWRCVESNASLACIKLLGLHWPGKYLPALFSFGNGGISLDESGFFWVSGILG